MTSIQIENIKIFNCPECGGELKIMDEHMTELKNVSVICTRNNEHIFEIKNNVLILFTQDQ